MHQYRKGKLERSPEGEELILKPHAYKQSELYTRMGKSDGVPFA